MQQLIIIALLLLTSFSYSQAKKPTLMVVPADNWCFENGYSEIYNNQGVIKDVPSYRIALQRDTDLDLVITQINGTLSQRGFDAKNLKSQLDKIERVGAEEAMRSSKYGGAEVSESPIDALKKVAKADIILKLGWTVNDDGMEKQVTFILKAIDSYTGKQIAQASGTGAPDFSSPLPILLEEAVASHIDSFLSELQTAFERWFEDGREINLGIRVWDDWDYDLESDEFGDDELGFLIENWLDDNTVSGRYTTMDAEATMMNFEQVRIPMTYLNKNGIAKGLDARRWAKGLSSYLKEMGIENKLTIRGLGEATLYLGSK
ncbi:MAG: hypothetical protein HOF75_08775 [Flavobacteriaceae bacterium]|nr:hypothetical protein [Flavobacteriaceae bacterium]MBT3919211.1 hypothetical protein [Flavobacteriaceae bacterium]MBT6704347.1 hypothetical protein [Flavobacteriaceae bacterium]MBT7242345.1 hypothetical protein [Flavobacteriaceae bacterium]